jgi:hypothetical protein
VDSAMREHFIRLGGPSMLQHLLHAAVLSPLQASQATLICPTPGIRSTNNNSSASTSTSSSSSSTDLCLPPELTVMAASSFASHDPETIDPKDQHGRKSVGGSFMKKGKRKYVAATSDNYDMANQVLSVLTEVCLSDEKTASTLSAMPGLIPRLFDLMASPPLLDGAVSLAQVFYDVVI